MHHVGNTMNQLIFGLTYQEDDGTWRWLRHLLEEGTKLVGVAGPLNFLPCLRYTWALIRSGFPYNCWR